VRADRSVLLKLPSVRGLYLLEGFCCFLSRFLCFVLVAGTSTSDGHGDGSTGEDDDGGDAVEYSWS
jgi:hypothetical protein